MPQARAPRQDTPNVDLTGQLPLKTAPSWTVAQVTWSQAMGFHWLRPTQCWSQIGDAPLAANRPAPPREPTGDLAGGSGSDGAPLFAMGQVRSREEIGGGLVSPPEFALGQLPGNVHGWGE
jgi:hypothetical protein